MTAFVRLCEDATGRSFRDAAAFHRFSVDELRLFWALFLRFAEVAHGGSPARVCTDDDCERATFFPDLELGYVESVLAIDAARAGELPALTSIDIAGRRTRLTRRALADRVARFARALEGLGVVAGDHVVAIVHNDAEAVVAALGVAALGAVLATCSPDMGAFSIVRRFAPLAPRLLLTHVEGADDAASAALRERASEVARGLPSLRAVVVLDGGRALSDLAHPTHRAAELVAAAAPMPWRRFPFSQPLFVLFSSGTTGAPKQIVHGAGGTLLEHLKEHRLHCDLRAGDKLFFHTSCSWMMWNWQLSALATGAEIVVSARHVEGPETLWRVVADEGVTVFGTSPAYLQMGQDAGFSPKSALSFPALRAILSTGSILHDHQYDWVKREVGDLPLQSISGGTDILGCFALGDPNLPVLRGESQRRSLGMDVVALPESEGSAIGELVCKSPFPSRPIGFRDDPDGARFHAAYFAQNPGMWTHGDRIEVRPSGGVRFHGRSDGVLNVDGVRIGPAEIYRILQAVPEVAESLAIEQRTRDDRGASRLVLLVVTKGGRALDGALERRIRSELARRGSPSHVPRVVLAVSDLPTTYSGKRSERAARDALEGAPSTNGEALRNPETLVEIRDALARHEATTLPTLASDAPLDDRVTAVWESVLGIRPLAPEDDFFSLGGTSLLALRLCNRLRSETGRELAPSALLAAPTIAKMTELLRKASGPPFVALAPLKTTGARNPLFVVHGIAGDVFDLRALAAHLAIDRPVYGCRAHGLDPRQEAHRTVEEMAVAYVEDVRTRQPKGPYAIAGYSFGGLVAFEMARRLHVAGERVELLALLDTGVHDGCLPLRARAEFLALRKAHRALGRAPLARWPALAAARDRARKAIEARYHATHGEPAPRDHAAEMTPRMRQVEEVLWRAFRAYRPRPSPVAITFFRAQRRPLDYCLPIPIWAAAASGNLRIRDVPGDHFTMMQSPNVEVLAARLAGCLPPPRDHDAARCSCGPEGCSHHPSVKESRRRY